MEIKTGIGLLRIRLCLVLISINEIQKCKSSIIRTGRHLSQLKKVLEVFECRFNMQSQTYSEFHPWQNTRFINCKGKIWQLPLDKLQRVS